MNKVTDCTTLLCICLLLFITNQCNVRSPYSKSLSVIKSHFPDTLSSHFPSSFNGKYRIKFISPEKCRSNGWCGVFLITDLSEKQKQSLQNALQSRKIASEKFNPKLNLIVDLETFINVYSNDPDTNKAETIFNSTPIPNFPKIINESKLIIPQNKIDINDLDIYILNGSPGRFIDSALLTFGEGLPKEWRNGYTKGIAISRKGINAIYWFEIW